MPYFLSPIANEQQFNASGAPLNGGKIYTYSAGSTTALATYTDSTGTTPQANPIILNSLGVSTSPIWLLGGVAAKFVIKDASDNTLRTIDNITGINDVAGASVNEWVASNLIPTYISGTSFSFSGDQRAVFQVDRRVLTTNTAGSRYGTITASVFSAGVTTITLLMDSGTLDSGLSAVFYGIISVTNTSLPLTSSGLVAAINSALLAPGPIGSTTPNTGAFTTLSSSGLTTANSLAVTNASTFSGALRVIGASALGYDAGAGGTVTQATDKATPVTLNKPTGQITMNAAALAAGATVTFQVNNSLITTADTVLLTCPFITVGPNNYRVEVSFSSNGSFNIRVTNISVGSLSEALVINFALIKGATA